MTQRARSGRSTRASAAKLRTVAKVKEPKGQNTDGMNGGNQFSIVAVDRFIQATRDSGYKNTSSAVAELVDNAIQADATRIRITVCHATDGETSAVELLVQDDGTGMDPFTLRTALRFGGTTRFNDRTGLGGVVARIVTSPHDAHRQDPHLPMRYDTGRPRAVIRLRISQPRTTSLPCPAGLRARRPSPMMDL